jgi:hypothetical protein
MAAGWRVTVKSFRLLRATTSPARFRHFVAKLRASKHFVNNFAVFLYNDGASACSATWFLNGVSTNIAADTINVANRRHAFFSNRILYNGCFGRAVNRIVNIADRRDTLLSWCWLNWSSGGAATIAASANDGRKALCFLWCFEDCSYWTVGNAANTVNWRNAFVSGPS